MHSNRILSLLKQFGLFKVICPFVKGHIKKFYTWSLHIHDTVMQFVMNYFSVVGSPMIFGLAILIGVTIGAVVNRYSADIIQA